VSGECREKRQKSEEKGNKVKGFSYYKGMEI
jgi:hypothetical protein